MKHFVSGHMINAEEFIIPIHNDKNFIKNYLKYDTTSRY